MKMIIKGMNCNTKLEFVLKEDGLRGYTMVMSKMNDISKLCDFFLIEEETNEYTIVKLHSIIEEPILSEIDYPIKPDKYDIIEIDNEELTIRKVVCHMNGSVTVYTDKMVNENVTGHHLFDIKQLLNTEMKIRNAVKNCNEIKEKKKKFTLFNGGKNI